MFVQNYLYDPTTFYSFREQQTVLHPAESRKTIQKLNEIEPKLLVLQTIEKNNAIALD